MIKSILYGFFALLLLTVSGCCSKKSISRRYYTIDISERLKEINRTSSYLINGRCEITHVDIEDAFATKRIANRSQSHEITYYVYNEWAHSPVEIITRSLTQFVESQGIFSEVATRFTAYAPGYRIETSIEQLEAVESKSEFEAYLVIDFRLVELKNGTVLVSHRADQKKSLAQKDLNLFAAAISDLLYDEMLLFSSKIKEAYLGKPSLFH